MPCVCLTPITDDAFKKANQKTKIDDIPIVQGSLDIIPPNAQRFIVEKIVIMRPTDIVICDGSDQQVADLKKILIDAKMMAPLKAYENNWIVRTDPQDVARVEGKTWIVTPDKYETVCHTPPGIEPIMGHWMDPAQFEKELDERFPGCMKGRRCYVIPYSMGPIGGPISKIGIEITDSPYVVLCMTIMTRVSSEVWKALGDGPFVRCIHSVGCPLPLTSMHSETFDEFI
ncbi:hypothetical protein AB6A40_007962 [Gnathostoma spinigerum]|uniref:Phosphoenolpyruvate carboxykinase GTP-utilising N-terminal domain-containing protein n=1 Tax=Gnathostoma spinigerum TaxID=75299 RepID=A0ABD6EW17_9BILA